MAGCGCHGYSLSHGHAQPPGEHGRLGDGTRGSRPQAVTATDLRYPIGPFAAPLPLDEAGRAEAVATIVGTPARLREAVAGLDDVQLDTPYRPDGWTVRQVVHHVPDSHLNAYVRFKLALTEDHPTIKPYDQVAWAGLSDSAGPIGPSLEMLDLLHQRWVRVLREMSAGDFNRTFNHPEEGVLTLDILLGLYAWHGPHHVAHITALRARMGW
ncbi:MAG: putative metal-dependent hydrolase [Gemmatimonadales bacterium]|nr:MAG: putative metal-dependent hydrolase [Gemmatimonadales bacterium]